MQMVFAWLERWLAQRRTREIFGLVFILLMLSLQLIGPIVAHLNKASRPEFRRAFEVGSQVQAVLPPGLASDAIAQALHARIVVGLSSLALLAALRAGRGISAASQDSGSVRGRESERDGGANGHAANSNSTGGLGSPGILSGRRGRIRKGNALPGAQRSHAADPDHAGFHAGGVSHGTAESDAPLGRFSRTPDMAFPGAAAYALLVLTNLVYNNFGADSGGIQFFYASPVQFSPDRLGQESYLRRYRAW